ncbi:hypothetical protein [Motilimonas sp. KMU-193]|uniref:hypothetical protein n=1 Tax=Motilimonas sp. KMU-193 TaxID=3388668 RepID=UPI00396B1B60
MNMIQLPHFQLSMLLMFALTACGGGGGGGASDSAEAQVSLTPSPTVEVTPAPSPEPTMSPQPDEQTTKNLVAPADFDFAPDNKVTLQVELHELLDQRAYFSLYQSYHQHQDGSLTPFYASRIVATGLIQGKLNTSLSLAKAQTQYLAEIWFYDGRRPLQQILYVEQNQLIWQ